MKQSSQQHGKSASHIHNLFSWQTVWKEIARNFAKFSLKLTRKLHVLSNHLIFCIIDDIQAADRENEERSPSQ